MKDKFSKHDEAEVSSIMSGWSSNARMSSYLGPSFPVEGPQSVSVVQVVNDSQDLEKLYNSKKLSMGEVCG